MRYNLEKAIDKQKFKERCNRLFEEQAIVDLTKWTPKRTLPQNRYLHLLFTWFAIEYGESADYVKQYFYKQVANPDIFLTQFVNVKTGEVREDWKSTKDLSVDEMRVSIERFRDWASKEAEIYLPSADERDFLNEIEIQEKSQKLHR